MQPSVLAGEGLDDNEGWAEEYLTGVESDIYIGQARVQRSVLADEVEEMEGHEQRDRPHSPFLKIFHKIYSNPNTSWGPANWANQISKQFYPKLRSWHTPRASDHTQLC